MITRIVKMTFDPLKVDAFLSLFEEFEFKIRQQPGCFYLELLREKSDGNVFFTYSKWIDNESLERYRHSETFKNVWPQTKAAFIAPAEAWTLDAREAGVI